MSQQGLGRIGERCTRSRQGLHAQTDMRTNLMLSFQGVVAQCKADCLSLCLHTTAVVSAQTSMWVVGAHLNDEDFRAHVGKEIGNPALLKELPLVAIQDDHIAARQDLR